MARRTALLRAAEERNFLVVEDDYEFEMSFLTPVSPSIKSLDTGGRVVHAGSFSKSIFPGLRLGWLVGPEPFIREARALRAQVLRHPPGQLQRTAAHFLSLGHYDALVNRMKAAFRKRRQAMEEAISHHGLKVAGQGGFGGSSFWMEATRYIDTEELALRLRRELARGRRQGSGIGAVARYRRLSGSFCSAAMLARRNTSVNRVEVITMNSE